ncbi:putative symbiosis island integrase [Bradyrhizobium oligotrophicum S58]|uniref:Putative symbiosis island integrase n=1 Tax=Bradyrhizobium oligotrophicum S58 TaxID=1245469 RepID=M4Z2G5_9BRAD|nr:putative symbiosis island integrase [Bradyrhizobium oligotrophicum]BAM86906.1 putative symbiosis island integrase [Bradyrhizobium oligotrophicum S58]
MPTLTRRRDPHSPNETWRIYFGDVEAGTIAERPEGPSGSPVWQWFCGFYPGSHPGEQQLGRANTYEQARDAFQTAWNVFLSNRSQQDFDEWRQHHNTLNKRLRLLGIDTKTDHCAHGFRTTFSTLSHHEEIKEAKAWDGDVVELQLAHLDSSTVEGLYKKHGPLALIGSRAKLMQHWADRIDHWLDPKKVMPIKRGT